jgi:hypothetical protein
MSPLSSTALVLYACITLPVLGFSHKPSNFSGETSFEQVNKSTKGCEAFLFIIVVIFTLILVCNRRPLTFQELARYQYDPYFRAKYFAGKI